METLFLVGGNVLDRVLLAVITTEDCMSTGGSIYALTRTNPSKSLIEILEPSSHKSPTVIIRKELGLP